MRERIALTRVIRRKARRNCRGKSSVMNRTVLSIAVGFAAGFLANAPAWAADNNDNSSGLIAVWTIKGTDVMNPQN